MSPKDLCGTVLKMNRNINFVGVVDGLGSLVAEASRGSSVFKRKSEAETGYLFQGVAVFKVTRDAQDEAFGSTDFVYVKRKKVSQFSVPIGDKTIFIVMKPNVSFGAVEALVKKVRAFKEKV